MARFVSVACAMLGARVAALEVVSPMAGDTVVADRTFTVEWTGTESNSRFDIDLYYCGSACFADDCGEWVTALCPYGETGCPDNEGDYDIVMPSPMSGTSGSSYKIKVMNVADESEMDCSDEFYLIDSDEAPTVNDADGPSLEVTAPSEGDVAIAGAEYTVEFDYDDGFGYHSGRFAIDLYMVDGSGDCGTFFASICDKASIGCKDSQGDYDVEIPFDTPSGMYSIRVGVFDDDTVFGCSDEFEVVSEDDEEEGGGISMSFRF